MCVECFAFVKDVLQYYDWYDMLGGCYIVDCLLHKMILRPLLLECDNWPWWPLSIWDKQTRDNAVAALCAAALYLHDENGIVWKTYNAGLCIFMRVMRTPAFANHLTLDNLIDLYPFTLDGSINLQPSSRPAMCDEPKEWAARYSKLCSDEFLQCCELPCILECWVSTGTYKCSCDRHWQHDVESSGFITRKGIVDQSVTSFKFKPVLCQQASQLFFQGSVGTSSLPYKSIVSLFPFAVAVLNDTMRILGHSQEEPFFHIRPSAVFSLACQVDQVLWQENDCMDGKAMVTVKEMAYVIVAKEYNIVRPCIVGNTDSGLLGLPT